MEDSNAFKTYLAAETNENMLFAEGFDDALVGYIERAGGPTVAVYDTNKCIAILQGQGMDEVEALEYFYRNVVGSFMGEHTPVFLTTISEEDIWLH